MSKVGCMFSGPHTLCVCVCVFVADMCSRRSELLFGGLRKRTVGSHHAGMERC